jgi:predicted nuclease with TOPRIM domain
MDAELKQCFDRLEGKVDNLADRFDKMERAHDIDHDKIIRVETTIENNVKDFDRHLETEKTEGVDISKRVGAVEKRMDGVDKKMIIFGSIIAAIAGGVGGSVGEVIRSTLGVIR